MSKCPVRQGSNCPGDIGQYEGVELIMAGAHCHAPACLSLELYNEDTGQLICRNDAIYGSSEQVYDCDNERHNLDTMQVPPIHHPSKILNPLSKTMHSAREFFLVRGVSASARIGFFVLK